MNRYNQRQTGNKSMLIAIVAVVLAFAIVIASVLTTGYLLTGTANVRKWGSQTQLPAPDIGGETDDNGDEAGTNVIVTPGEEHGISLTQELIAPDEYGNYGVSEQVQAAYEITATAFDENGSSNCIPQDMEASAEWKNSKGFWSKNKDVINYISIEKTGENQFLVSCLQAYGEPVILTIKSLFSDASATKQFDYLMSVSSVTFDVYPEGKLEFTDIYVEPNIGYGTGTVKGDVYINKMTYCFSEDYCEAIRNSSYYKYFEQQCAENGFDNLAWSEDFDDHEIKDNIVDYVEGSDDFSDWTIILSPKYEDIFAMEMGLESARDLASKTDNYKYFKYAMLDAMNNYGETDVIWFDYTWSYKYNGVEYNSKFEVSQDYNLDLSEVTLPKVSNITIDGEDSYVFFK